MLEGPIHPDDVHLAPCADLVVQRDGRNDLADPSRLGIDDILLEDEDGDGYWEPDELLFADASLRTLTDDDVRGMPMTFLDGDVPDIEPSTDGPLFAAPPSPASTWRCTTSSAPRNPPSPGSP